MAISYNDMSQREYMERMQWKMERERQRYEEMNYRGITQDSPAPATAAPTKPAHLNPKLLLIKGA